MLGYNGHYIFFSSVPPSDTMPNCPSTRREHPLMASISQSPINSSVQLIINLYKLGGVLFFVFCFCIFKGLNLIIIPYLSPEPQVITVDNNTLFFLNI